MRLHLLLCVATLASCVTLHPWERERLISGAMADPHDPLEEAFDEHVQTTREGMSGATEGGGASCGCD